MTRYAVGDIHGGSRTFRTLLDTLALRHNDRLYLMGDYVDRGNDSKGVLDIILQLMDAGYDVRPIRGNHDDMMLRAFTGVHDDYSWHWEKVWGQFTLASFGVDSLEHVSMRYLTLLDALPTILMEEDYIFVHAALNMSLDDPISQTPEVGIRRVRRELEDGQYDSRSRRQQDHSQAVCEEQNRLCNKRLLCRSKRR